MDKTMRGIHWHTVWGAQDYVFATHHGAHLKADGINDALAASWHGNVPLGVPRPSVVECDGTEWCSSRIVQGLKIDANQAERDVSELDAAIAALQAKRAAAAQAASAKRRECDLAEAAISGRLNLADQTGAAA